MKVSISLVVLIASVCLAAPQQKKEEILTATAKEQAQTAQLKQANEAQKIHDQARANEVMLDSAMTMGRGAYGGGAASYGGYGAHQVGIFSGVPSSPCQVPFMVSCSPTIVRGNTLSPCGHSAYGAGSYGAGAYGAAAPAVISSGIASAGISPAYRNADLQMSGKATESWSSLDQQMRGLPVLQQHQQGFIGQNEMRDNSQMMQQQQQQHMIPAPMSFVPQPVQEFLNQPVQRVQRGLNDYYYY